MLSNTGGRSRSSRSLLVHKPPAATGPTSPTAAPAQKPQNNFVALVLPYLNNSSSWHVREELLNVLILCFLRSKNIFEFDQYSVLEALLRGLDDQKERNRFIALEAIVAFASIGNKIGTREIIY